MVPSSALLNIYAKDYVNLLLLNFKECLTDSEGPRNCIFAPGDYFQPEV